MNFNKYNNNYNIISKNLKKLRLEKKLSQEQLSNKLSLLGITLYQSDIFRIEITKILGISSEELYAP